MLTRADYGLAITGRVDAIEPLRHRQGVGKGSGQPYSFWQQSASIAIGGEMFEVNFRADTDPGGDLVPFELDEVVRIRVGAPRVYNGKTSFDAA
ncbi:hypothetical protein HNR46_000093 [Haloferula luteola]|uniref:Uncharacterized protein n=1 Tax=Haloferula luteola TaxID=595692 RepID=A0A840UVR1_9BACT|nr:hypothetical protein [Haloferula luteola]MBB5349872.1 hypothetical protein [Haloferula luteola]